MTGPVTVSSSCPKIGSNDEAQRATLSPPLILTSNGHSDLTEKPSSKSNPNPISPADDEDDDDAKFVKGTNLTQENEQALKDMTRNVLNASENYGVEKFGVTADVEPKPNFILDGQEVVRVCAKTVGLLYELHIDISSLSPLHVIFSCRKQNYQSMIQRAGSLDVFLNFYPLDARIVLKASHHLLTILSGCHHQEISTP